jgi:glycosyltransferase involved in cell wall biosynthesis
MTYGGAETQIAVLANGLSGLGHSITLIVFYPGGPLLERLSPDLNVRCLERRGPWDVVRVRKRLLSVLVEEQPEIVYAFLPGPNIMACLAKFQLPKLKIAWGVRSSDMVLRRYPWATRVPYFMERWFSGWPDLIISNSYAGRRSAVAHGFPDIDRFIVIPNGIDTKHFRPDVKLGEALRQKWGVARDETLIGIVARLDPMKGHETFLEAARKVAQSRMVRFVSVGAGPEEYANDLREQGFRIGLNGRMIWAGERSDLPAVYNALDILVSSSSFGEGFSNVLGEAMSCGVPCVATEVGDAREILGELGVVVPRRDPQALAEGILTVVERPRAERATLGAQMRQRVVENFSVDKFVWQTAEALSGMLLTA